MEDFKDGFIVCPRCGSKMCYAQQLDGQETYMCLSCGFTSTSKMLDGSEVEKAISEKHPNLYKDLRFVDENGLVWYPSVMTVPGKGMVYIDGSNSEDWQWVMVPVRNLLPKEQKLPKYKGRKYVVDTKNTRYFGKDGFINAASAVGLFGDE